MLIKTFGVFWSGLPQLLIVDFNSVEYLAKFDSFIKYINSVECLAKSILMNPTCGFGSVICGCAFGKPHTVAENPLDLGHWVSPF